MNYDTNSSMTIVDLVTKANEMFVKTKLNIEGERGEEDYRKTAPPPLLSNSKYH